MIIYLFIVLQYVVSPASCSLKTLDDSGENSTPKRRKTIMGDVIGECIVDGESGDSSKNSESTSKFSGKYDFNSFEISVY